MPTMFIENTNSWANVALVVLGVWSLVLTILLSLTLRHYRRLVKGVGKENLQKLMEKIVRRLKEQETQEKESRELLRALEKKGESDYQKMGLVRFNPFAEMGGNQSFSFALLDGLDSGFLITSLHGRSLTRLYVKRVKQGKPVDGKLSKEEELAIKQSMGRKSK